MHTGRSVAAVAALVLLIVAPILAQADVAGEWAVNFGTPSGPVEFTMYVTQSGPSLKGRLTSDAGEFPLSGRVEGDQIRIVWSLPERGKMMEITFTGKVEGDSIKGTAKLEGVGEGPLSAERTGQ